MRAVRREPGSPGTTLHEVAGVQGSDQAGGNRIRSGYLGRHGRHFHAPGEWTYVRPLKDGTLRVPVFNLGSSRLHYPFRLDLVRLRPHGVQQADGLWTGKTMTLNSSTSLDVKPRDVPMLRIAGLQ